MKNPYRIAAAIVSFFALETVLYIFFDQSLSEYLRTVDAEHPAIINFFRAYTDLGKSKWYLEPAALGIAICALLIRLNFVSMKGRVDLARLGNALLLIFCGVGLAGIITDIIKPIVGRARPVLLLREHTYGFHPFTHGAMWESMPSGHSTNACALMMTLVILLPRLRALWLVLAVLLALSRVMVNAHYLSDTFAGAAVGILTVLMVQKALDHDRIIPLRRWIFPIDR